MTSKIIFGLYGANGFGREVMPMVGDVIARRFGKQAADVEIVFIETSPTATEVIGIPLLSEQDFIGSAHAEKYFNIAIADSKVRQQIAARCERAGVRPLSLHAGNVVNTAQSDIGKGSILCGFSTITSNAKIGAYFHSNIYSYVAHDCVIGDFVTFAPRVSCNGNVHIGTHAYIGTGAVIKQGRPGDPLIIGEGAIVGMGAVVTKSVAPHTTVVGNPARAMK
jgi:hypothetical protein